MKGGLIVVMGFSVWKECQLNTIPTIELKYFVPCSVIAKMNSSEIMSLKLCIIF